MGYPFLQRPLPMNSTAVVINGGPDLVRKLDELSSEVTKLRARIEQMKPVVPTQPDRRRSHLPHDIERREAP